MTTMLDDLRFTQRQLRRSPGFLLITVATLTLAIAANAVVYGTANTLILRPLPIPEPQRLVEVQNPGFAGLSFRHGGRCGCILPSCCGRCRHGRRARPC